MPQSSRKKAVITGATKGIGKAIAIRFASEGFDLAICARTKKDIDQLEKELQKNFPSIDVIAVACDLSKKKEVISFAKTIQSKWKSISVLINNAGIYLSGQVHSEEEGRLEYLLNTNLMSAYHLTRSLIKGMKKNKHGHIFNNCSIASIHSYPDGGSYSIAKHALLGFSRALRVELMDHNIRVTSIIAGATWTDSWKGTSVPEKRMMPAEDVAEMIWSSYKLSDRSVIEEIIMRPMKGDL